MQVPPNPGNYYPPQPPAPMRVRFDAIGDGWKLYQADSGTWMLSVFLVGLVTAVPTFVIQALVRGLMLGPNGTPTAETIANGTYHVTAANGLSAIVTSLCSVFIGAFTGILTTGLHFRAVLQARGLRPTIAAIFDLRGNGVRVLAYHLLFLVTIFPLQAVAAYSVAMAGPTAMMNPDVLASFVACQILAGLIQALFTFTPLIIVDQGLSLFEAIRKCVVTFGPQYLPLVGVLLCTQLLALSGIIGCCVGVIFTIPVLYATTGVIYNDFFRPQPKEQEGFVSPYPRFTV